MYRENQYGSYNFSQRNDGHSSGESMASTFGPSEGHSSGYTTSGTQKGSEIAENDFKNSNARLDAYHLFFSSRL